MKNILVRKEKEKNQSDNNHMFFCEKIHFLFSGLSAIDKQICWKVAMKSKSMEKEVQ